mmetsp:Transcript_6073/g.6676  ORF Transcript_6073/g.6676 Transcript_6073/m.6676 type:complete len:313 (+) Transcript_6073:33-971(+)
MDQNPSNSRIGVQFGKFAEGDEKTSIKVCVNFGKEAADLQAEKLKELLGGDDPNLSVVLVLTPPPGKQEELETFLKSTFDAQDNSDQNQIARELSRPFRRGELTYSIKHSGSKVVLQLSPGERIAEFAKQMAGMMLGFGVEEIASTEKASVHLHLLSGTEFTEIPSLHEKQYSTFSAFLRSFLGELTLKSTPGTQLDKKLFALLKQVVPKFSKSPLPLLELVQSVDVDFAFQTADELDPEIRKNLTKDRDLKLFPRFPHALKDREEGRYIEKFVSLLTSHVEVYATLANVAAVHIEINTPGFGLALITPQPE